MNKKDRIEFYSEPKKLVAALDSSMVPPVGSKINIRGKTWVVQSVTYAVDNSASINEAQMRANIDLEPY